LKLPADLLKKLTDQGIIPPAPKQQKYRAKPVRVDGIWFASTKEARRYSELKLLLQAGEIFDLKLQPTFTLKIGKELICRYRGDFQYLDKNGQRIVEDAKGLRLPIYRLKKRLMKALLGITITEV
jgi:hypothetical protein